MKHIIRLEASDIARMKDGEVLQLREGLLLDIEPSQIGRPRGSRNGHSNGQERVITARVRGREALPPPKETWPCMSCGEVFESMEERHKHSIKAHSHEQKGQKKKKRLPSHMRKHMGMPPKDARGVMTCTYCGTYTATSDAQMRGHLGAHVRNKTGGI